MIRGVFFVAAMAAMPKIFGQPTVQLVPVMNTGVYITDVVHAGDDRLFVVAKNGVIRIIQDGQLLPTPFLDINAQTWGSGELGCLGLAFDPLYEENGWFYVHYTANPGTVENRVSRFTVSSNDPNIAHSASEQILWSYPQPAIIHKGGDLEFGPDGSLYISLGDAGTFVGAQDLTNPYGSILRIDVSGADEYSIPPDNPFADATGDTLPEIWAYGLRNPYRITIDTVTDLLWIADVGWQSWEEVNVWPIADNSAPNYGWPCKEGIETVPGAPGCDSPPASIDPIHVQPNGSPWCAIIGGRVYRGGAFPSLYGRYIYSDHCAGLIHSLRPDGNAGWIDEELASGLNFGITTIGNDVDGELYLGMSNGMLYRIIDPLFVDVHENEELPITIFPNPANDLLSLHVASSTETTFNIFDAGGRLAMQVTSNGTSAVTMDVSTLHEGVYSIQGNSADGKTTQVRKLVVIR
jgi:glucose/arabinose dehydrogenase